MSIYATQTLLDESRRRAARGGLRDEEFAFQQEGQFQKQQADIADLLQRFDDQNARLDDANGLAEEANEIAEKARTDFETATEALQKQIQEIIDFALPQLKNPDASAGGAVEQDEHKRQKWGARVPTGTIVLTSNTVPPGWLECDGTEIRSDENYNLYTVIGEKFGTPSSVNFFKLPAPADLPAMPSAHTRWIIRK